MSDPRTEMLKLADRFDAADNREAGDMTRRLVQEMDVEYQAALDRIILGNSFVLEVADPASPTGTRKTRLDPTAVTFRTEPDHERSG